MEFFLKIFIQTVAFRREIGSYRDDCDKLDRDPRLHDSTSMKKVALPYPSPYVLSTITDHIPY